MAFKEFGLNEVTILDEYSKQITKKVIEYINRYNADRLLYNFRLTAGFTDGFVVNKPYPGWESSRLGGHTLGHYIVAAAQGVAHGYGETKGEDGKTLKERLEYIISSLDECQKRTNGFLWGANLEKPDEPECQFNRLENNNAKETWAPWYTMHKLLNGLVEVYKLTGNLEALVVAENLGEWVYNRVSRWSEETKKLVWQIEYGGMNDCLYELFKHSKKNGYLQAEHFLVAAHQFDQEPLFEKVLNKEKDVLNGNHANTTIPKFIGALNRYRTIGEERYLDYAKAFWEMVINHHTYVTGGNSECEFFGMDDVLDAERSNTNCETCNTHNMLKLTRELFKITGERKYADYYENTYINAILASVNAKTGMTTYFQPMATGCFKVYCNPDFEKNYFWCCSGTGLENFTKLGDSFYFHTDDTVVVNQYESSQLNWRENGFVLEQNCNLEKGEFVYFTVKNAGDGTVRKIMLRKPDWLNGFCYVNTNGQGAIVEEGEEYITITKDWQNGDTFEVLLPMGIKLKTLPDNDRVYAFKYGPYVLACNLGKDPRFSTYQIGVQCDVCALKIVRGQKLKMNGSYGQTTNLPVLQKEILETKEPLPQFISNISKNLSWYNRDKCSFILKGVKTCRKMIFSPYYKLHDERYGIYWIFK